MKELIYMLHAGGYSCVIANGDRIRTFTRRGVADLYDLLVQEPEFLHGAFVADKVIGKAAASLMVLGGVRQVYTRTISQPALRLLQEAGVTVSCDEMWTTSSTATTRAGARWNKPAVTSSQPKKFSQL